LSHLEKASVLVIVKIKAITVCELGRSNPQCQTTYQQASTI
jgi:hypothetical protein